MKLLIVVGVLLKCFGSIFVDGQVQTYLKGSNRGKIWQQNDNNKELTLSTFRQFGDSKQSIVQQSFFAKSAEDENRRLDTTQNIIINFVSYLSYGGSTGDGGTAISALLNGPTAVSIDSNRNVYIADAANCKIRKVNSAGIINTYAGTGIAGNSGDGGAATSAQLNGPTAVSVGINGNVYIADPKSNKIRKVSSTGIITTFAGTGISGSSGDGGFAASAQLSSPTGVVVDISGNVYIIDFNSKIRKVSNVGIITTYAGTGGTGYIGSAGDGGLATAALFGYITAISVDMLGNAYIADSNYNNIRMISSVGIITTFAGMVPYGGDGGAATSALINKPAGISVDSNGNVYFADNGNNRIRKISTSGIITTIAGTGDYGSTGDGGAATSAQLGNPVRVSLDASGNMFIADLGNNKIRKVNSAGIITTYVGTGILGSGGDGGAATSAQLNQPNGASVDNSGNVYIADAGNNRIRKVNSARIITTYAGTGTSGSSGDSGAASSAQLNQPYDVLADNNGNVYISDLGNRRIRKVSSAGIITTFAGGWRIWFFY